MRLLRIFLSALLAVSAVHLAPTAAHANSKYAAYVIQADTGDVLFSRYPNSRRYPASLTKMMTLYLLFEEIEAGRLTLESKLKVSTTAAAQPPSKLGVKAGTTIDVETAIQALVVKSANDVAVVVAEQISGSEWRFAKKMTQEARAMGMSRTTFRNASGLPNRKQVTTAKDLAVLSRRISQDFPELFHYFDTDRFSWNGRSYRTHNHVARTYEGADGLKTGYTRMSGFNLATTAKHGDNRLIGIVLGGRSSRTRDAHMRKILTSSFAKIEKNPKLVASIHRIKPSPRMKPTLVAALAAQQASENPVPTLAGNRDMQDEIAMAALTFAAQANEAPDALGALIAAETDDLNEYQLARLSSAILHDGVIGQGDGETPNALDYNWHVQIGAYTSKELAQAELETAATRGALTDRARSVSPAIGNNGKQLFRAQFIGMAEWEARAACEDLGASGVECFVASSNPIQ